MCLIEAVSFSIVYMGSEDCRRQALNVFRMRNLGAKVVGVDSGSQTLKVIIVVKSHAWCVVCGQFLKVNMGGLGRH